MTFSPAELSLLAISDKAMNGAGRKWRHRQGRPGRLGRLTDAEAMILHGRGASGAEMATAADVVLSRVYIWRNKMGLTRARARKASA